MKGILSSAFAEAQRVLVMVFPLLLSHHPICKEYMPDMLKIGRVHLCKGCFLGYSFSLLVLAIYFILIPVTSWDIEAGPELLIPVGIVLGSLQFARAFIRRAPSWWKTVQKLLLGAGIASIIIGIIELPIDLLYRSLILFSCFLIYGLLGAALRLHYLKMTCNECRFEGDWERCEGLSGLYEKNRSTGPANAR
jgi:hypothetical protein